LDRARIPFSFFSKTGGPLYTIPLPHQFSDHVGTARDIRNPKT
jgi:hypothetical protein